MVSHQCMNIAHALALAAFVALLSARPLPAKVDFGGEILPLIKTHCVECHGPSQQMAGLRLDRRKDALPNRIGANGARIIPGKSESSRLYQRIAGTGAGTRMPPPGPLPAGQIALFKAWIDEGAEWPDAVAGDRSTAPVDPRVVEMMAALRSGEFQVFKRILHGHPKSVDGTGPSGWTPLMYAALYGGPEEIKLLLDEGANPNQRNDDGATALMYAVDDPGKTRLLLEKGADPNIRSGLGRTALVIASGWFGSASAVRLLLEKGVDPETPGDPIPLQPLNLAAAAGDLDSVRLLVERGAKKPRLRGASLYCAPCLDLLLPLADGKDLSGLLEQAVLTGDVRQVRRLLERGATARSGLLLAAATSPTPIPPEFFPAFVSRGASLEEKTSYGVTLLDLANRNRNAELVRFLREAKGTGEIQAQTVRKPKPAGSSRAAIERSLPLLQRSDVTFLEKAGCVSCHNNSLTAMTVSAARAKGFAVNEQIATGQLRRISAFLLDNGAGGMENRGRPGAADTVSYILIGMAAENYPDDMATDIWARYLKSLQRQDGSWRVLPGRPPIESSDFQVTASSVRALRVFGLKSRQPSYDRAAAAGMRWLEATPPRDTEDFAFKILGLVWGGGSREAIRRTVRDLWARQRPDGGWAQTTLLDSDAYATGQALMTIATAQPNSTGGQSFKRGTRYLLNTQLEDGSWYVRSRAPSLQPYFESDFPHGYDQFISAAATNWATLALLTSVPGSAR